MFISYKYDRSCIYNYNLTLTDLEPNNLTIHVFKKSIHFDTLKLALNSGALYYEDMNIKNAWYKIFRLINLS